MTPEEITDDILYIVTHDGWSVTETRKLMIERISAAVAAERDKQKALSVDFMNQLPTMWGDHVRDGKITITIDADLIERIEEL